MEEGERYHSGKKVTIDTEYETGGQKRRTSLDKSAALTVQTHSNSKKVQMNT